MAQNTENRLPRMRTKYFRFQSVTNELDLENHLSYLCTKFGENRWKISPASVDERVNFVTPEVGRRAGALHKSILAVNGAVNASLIWEPGEDRLKIEGARDYWLYWLRWDQILIPSKSVQSIRKVRLSPNSATVAVFCDSLTFLRQCGQGFADKTTAQNQNSRPTYAVRMHGHQVADLRKRKTQRFYGSANNSLWKRKRQKIIKPQMMLHYLPQSEVRHKCIYLRCNSRLVVCSQIRWGWK